MAQRKNVSIQMIAKECGVSTATVSRVINNDAKVANATREKILAALSKLGYQLPAHTTSNIKKVGIIINTQVNDYYHALEIKLHDELSELGLKCITASLGYKKDATEEILKTIYDCNVCGVILISCDYLSIKDILDPRIPHVWIDCNDPEESTKDICQVLSNQFVSGVMAANELYRKGSVKPIFLTGSSMSYRTKERFEGFCSEYKKHGITLDESRIIFTPHVREALDESKQTIRYLVNTNFEFDGIFAISDWRALGSYLVLNELGIKVPDEVRIVGYDGVSAASRTILNITSVQQDISLIARNAVDLLIKQIEDQKITSKRIIVPTDFLSGQTT